MESTTTLTETIIDDKHGNDNEAGEATKPLSWTDYGGMGARHAIAEEDSHGPNSPSATAGLTGGGTLRIEGSTSKAGTYVAAEDAWGSTGTEEADSPWKARSSKT